MIFKWVDLLIFYYIWILLIRELPIRPKNFPKIHYFGSLKYQTHFKLLINCLITTKKHATQVLQIIEPQVNCNYYNFTCDFIRFYVFQSSFLIITVSSYVQVIIYLYLRTTSNNIILWAYIRIPCNIFHPSRMLSKRFY